MYNKPKLISSRDIPELLKTEASFEQTRKSLYASVEGSVSQANKALYEENFTHSIYILDRAINELGPDPRLLKALAKVYIKTKEYKDALENVEYTLQINPNDEDAKGAKELLLHKINYQKLVTAFPLYS